MNLRHLIYLVVAFGSLVWAWSHGLDWIGAGGNLLNLPSFFIESFNSGSAAAFLTLDIAAVWAVYMIWVVGDAQRIGLGTKAGVLFLLLSILGTCFAFPLYLIRRERHLARLGETG